MRRFFAAAVLTSFFAASLILSRDALADEPAPAPADSASAADTPAESAPAANSGAPTGPDAWRYKRHDGMWWYWLPANSWVYWHNEKWVPYDAQSYGELRASQRQRSYSGTGGNSSPGNYSGNGNWGQWGPIRYDRYGNPQYPYSQRTRGMKQLGPVPTPGGVRSLPGWGGER